MKKHHAVIARSGIQYYLADELQNLMLHEIPREYKGQQVFSVYRPSHVLEGAKEGQIQEDPQDHHGFARLAPPGGAQPQEPVHQGEGRQEQEAGEPPEGAEHQAPHQEQPIAQALPGQEEIHQSQHRQKRQNKKRAVRTQFSHLPAFNTSLYRMRP